MRRATKWGCDGELGALSRAEQQSRTPAGGLEEAAAMLQPGGTMTPEPVSRMVTIAADTVDAFAAGRV